MSNRFYYLYSIAGIKILCDLPQQIEILHESTHFLQPYILAAELVEGGIFPEMDMYVSAEVIEELPAVTEWAVFQQGRFYDRLGDKVFMHMTLSEKESPYVCVVHSVAEKRIDILLKQGWEKFLRYSRHLSDLIGMETVFLHHHAMLLHGAFVRYKNRGLVFTAPSGTGKSTQATLWEQYEHADIVNGDRVGIRRDIDGWRAYGLPYAGTSGIYRNESALLQGIVVLRQASENHMRLLKPMEAIRYLYPELTVHRWDKVFVDKIMELVLDMLATMPIYLLECLPDRDAVTMVKSCLFEAAETRHGMWR